MIPVLEIEMRPELFCEHEKKYFEDRGLRFLSIQKSEEYAKKEFQYDLYEELKI